MSQPHGEPCYTAEEVDNLLKKERKEFLRNELYRAVTRATMEFSAGEVKELVEEALRGEESEEAHDKEIEREIDETLEEGDGLGVHNRLE